MLEPLLSGEHSADGGSDLRILIEPVTAANGGSAQANSAERPRALSNRPFQLGGFEQLPPVLLTQMMLFLDGRSALHVGEVCKAWREPSKSDKVWRVVCARELLLQDKPAAARRAGVMKDRFVQIRKNLFER